VENGCVLVRGIVSKENAAAAADALKSLAQHYGYFDPSTASRLRSFTESILDAKVTEECRVALANNVYKNTTFLNNMARIFGNGVIVEEQHSWVRIKLAGPSTATPEHADLAHFLNRKNGKTFLRDAFKRSVSGKQNTVLSSVGDVCCRCQPHVAVTDWLCASCCRSALPFYTVWCPMQRVEFDHALLAMLKGSHTSYHDYVANEEFLPKGYQCHAGDAGWAIPAWMDPGDALIFNIKTIHATTTNKSSAPRLSIDLRVFTPQKSIQFV
jgi:hypothetical protein